MAYLPKSPPSQFPKLRDRPSPLIDPDAGAITRALTRQAERAAGKPVNDLPGTFVDWYAPGAYLRQTMSVMVAQGSPPVRPGTMMAAVDPGNGRAASAHFAIGRDGTVYDWNSFGAAWAAKSSDPMADLLAMDKQLRIETLRPPKGDWVLHALDRMSPGLREFAQLLSGSSGAFQVTTDELLAAREKERLAQQRAALKAEVATMAPDTREALPERADAAMADLLADIEQPDPAFIPRLRPIVANEKGGVAIDSLGAIVVDEIHRIAIDPPWTFIKRK